MTRDENITMYYNIILVCLYLCFVYFGIYCCVEVSFFFIIQLSMGRALKVKPEPFFNRSYLVWITATGIFDNILIVMSKFVPLSWHDFFSFAVIFEPKINLAHKNWVKSCIC